MPLLALLAAAGSTVEAADGSEQSCDAACPLLGGSSGRPKVDQLFWRLRGELKCDTSGTLACELRHRTEAGESLGDDELESCAFTRGTVFFRYGGFGRKGSKPKKYSAPSGKDFFTASARAPPTAAMAHVPDPRTPS